MSLKYCALGAVAAAGIVGSLTSVASADVVLSFGYTDLAGSYDGAGGFKALAATSSTGDVTRLLSPAGQADFQTGFFGGSSADFALDLSVSSIGATTAEGDGSFTITDANGDTITGKISGDFSTPGFGITFFNGLLTDVLVTDVSGDGTFDGSVSGTSFGIDLSPITGPLDGALVQLFINTGSTGFFGGPFSGVSTQVAGEVIPAPASLALLGLGLITAGRRRR